MRGLPKVPKRLKCTIVSVTALLIVATISTTASAGKGGIRVSSVFKFSGGIVTAFTIHEASHVLVAGLTDTDMHWEAGTYNQPIGFTENASSDAKGLALNSAGLISQAVGSEIILRVDKIDKNSAYVRGIMAWNILNPILYALDYWFFRISNKETRNSYQGDLEGIERYSNEPTAHGFALSMAAIAAFQGYRFLKTQSWAPDWLKGKSHSINIEPLPSGGLVMTYKFVF